jgi:hypothetical protein
MRGHAALLAAAKAGLVSLTGGEMLANAAGDDAIAWVLEATSAGERRIRIGQVWAAVRGQGIAAGRSAPSAGLVCERCGAAIGNAVRLSRKFCSNACRQAAHRHRGSRGETIV